MELTNQQIKIIKSLSQKKFRQKYQYFAAEGDKIVREALASSFTVVAIYALPAWIDQNLDKLRPFNGVLHSISTRQLQQISQLKTPNQALILLQIPKEEVKVSLISSGFHFYLDRIQNPGNIGTIIRIADWFGFKSVIASPETVDFYNPKVIQATMASFLRVPLIRDLNDILSKNSHTPVYIADIDGTDINSMKFEEKGIIVIGNEGGGISKLFEKVRYHKITIPRAIGSEAESLNAAVSAGIIASRIGI